VFACDFGTLQLLYTVEPICKDTLRPTKCPDVSKTLWTADNQDKCPDFHRTTVLIVSYHMSMVSSRASILIFKCSAKILPSRHVTFASRTVETRVSDMKSYNEDMMCKIVKCTRECGYMYVFLS